MVSLKSAGGSLRPVAYTDERESACRATLFLFGLVFIAAATAAVLIYHILYPAARLYTVTSFDIHELLRLYDNEDIMSLSCPCEYQMKYSNLNHFNYNEANVSQLLPIDFTSIETQCIEAGELAAQEYTYSTYTSTSNTSVRLTNLLSNDDCNATWIAFDMTRRMIQSKAPSNIVLEWVFNEDLRDAIADQCYSFFEDRMEMFHVFKDPREPAWYLIDRDIPCFEQAFNNSWDGEEEIFLEWVELCNPETCSYIKNAGLEDAVLDTVAISGTLSSLTITTLAMIYKLFIQQSKSTMQLSEHSQAKVQQVELAAINPTEQ